jgi:Vitamin K-dependent gamma-carboxylase
MMDRVIRLWDAAWFAPEPAINLRACRILLALQALWVTLSRPDIPSLTEWPRAFFPSAARLEYLRFGISHGHNATEWLLWVVLHVLLVLIIAGVWTRVTCAAAAVLLYHFAPFEEIIAGMPHTHFGGLTIPMLGFLILSFAEQPRRNSANSDEYRWPLALIQLIFAFTYFFAFLAKLRYSGILWFTGPTIREFLITGWGITHSRWALGVAARPWMCWTLAIATFCFELLFPLAVFSHRARRVLIPVALLFHLGNALLLDIIFPSEALLLLFVNWDWVAERFGRWSGTKTVTADNASR